MERLPGWPVRVTGVSAVVGAGRGLGRSGEGAMEHAGEGGNAPVDAEEPEVGRGRAASRVVPGEAVYARVAWLAVVVAQPLAADGVPTPDVVRGTGPAEVKAGVGHVH